MAPTDDPLPDGFPPQIRAGATKELVYVRQPGYFALHGEPLPTTRAVVVFEAEGIAILRGAPAGPLAPGQQVSPVYAPKDGVSLACPTGRLFIRFREGDTVEAHRVELAQAGFPMAEGLEHAPRAGWLRARSGSIGDALAGVSRLEAMAGVESVEVQLLMQRAYRSL
ncbi:hypothetical protein [Synechococcus sp. CCY 9618]|uniref:hypothetical protein n=1 Tax=Synechococcus sp. CCY 9618 TaxID=2815602 RepID=UPI001C22AFE9|nr:hypothetical protein [Synechococcus sp. CCY 9618]